MQQANNALKESRDDDAAGNELNTIAMPSQLEIMKKAYEQRKKDMQETTLKKLLDKYGGE
jgi:hypothetical protein